MCPSQRNAAPLSMVGRAFTLLRAFQPGGGELSLAELCRRTGFPKSTAHRIVLELVDCGALERTPAGVRLGLSLFEIGQLVPRQRDLLETASPILADLYEATRETVHLAVADGTDVVYVQKLTRSGAPDIPSRLGGRMPSYCTGVGKAILAFRPPEQLNAVFAAGLRRRTPRTVIAPGLLRAELDTVRQRGIAEEHEESTRGIACVAAPILGTDGHAVAALSISGWANRLNTGRLAPAVRTAALGLTRALVSAG